MKITTLRRDWRMTHPDGNVWIYASNGELLDDGKQTGKFAVIYTAGGKIYTYQMRSVYLLAERLGMIPQTKPDVSTEAVKAIESLKSGIPYASICGLSDEIHGVLGGNWYVVSSNRTTKDEYDRTVYTYTSLIEKSFS